MAFFPFHLIPLLPMLQLTTLRSIEKGLITGMCGFRPTFLICTLEISGMQSCTYMMIFQLLCIQLISNTYVVLLYFQLGMLFTQAALQDCMSGRRVIWHNVAKVETRNATHLSLRQVLAGIKCKLNALNMHGCVVNICTCVLSLLQ